LARLGGFCCSTGCEVITALAPNKFNKGLKRACAKHININYASLYDDDDDDDLQ
jgi:hypothetical protein